MRQSSVDFAFMRQPLLFTFIKGQTYVIVILIHVRVDSIICLYSYYCVEIVYFSAYRVSCSSDDVSEWQ